MPRKAIGKKTRFEVFKRDLFTCQYCGAHPPQVVLQVDHIVAVSAGGENHIDNYITSCQPCNIGKGARSLAVSPTALKDKAALVAESEAQLLGYQEILRASRERIEDEAWEVVRALFGEGRDTVSTNMYASIKQFVQRLGLDEVLNSADRALSKPLAYGEGVLFRYFCGVCWGKIRDNEAPFDPQSEVPF